jgi:hypothetical protein
LIIVNNFLWLMKSTCESKSSHLITWKYCTWKACPDRQMCCQGDCPSTCMAHEVVKDLARTMNTLTPRLNAPNVTIITFNPNLRQFCMFDLVWVKLFQIIIQTYKKKSRECQFLIKYIFKFFLQPVNTSVKQCHTFIFYICIIWKENITMICIILSNIKNTWQILNSSQLWHQVANIGCLLFSTHL